jgi:hypothetical protein
MDGPTWEAPSWIAVWEDCGTGRTGRGAAESGIPTERDDEESGSTW